MKLKEHAYNFTSQNNLKQMYIIMQYREKKNNYIRNQKI